MANEPMKNNVEPNGNEPNEPTVTDTAKDERIAELEAMVANLKQSVTNASADASKYKKQYNEEHEKFVKTLSAEEQKKIEHDERIATLQKERDDLLKERNVANHKAKFVSIGFEDSLADEAANAMSDGDNEKVFDALRRFITAHDKQLRENAFRANPTLPSGESGKPVTREQFEKMGYTERVKVFNDYPDLYKEFTS